MDADLADDCEVVLWGRVLSYTLGVPALRLLTCFGLDHSERGPLILLLLDARRGAEILRIE